MSSHRHIEVIGKSTQDDMVGGTYCLITHKSWQVRGVMQVLQIGRNDANPIFIPLSSIGMWRILDGEQVAWCGQKEE